MPKVAAIHPDTLEPGIPPLREPAPRGACEPGMPPPEAQEGGGSVRLPAGLDVEAGAERLRDLVVSHPLASLGATLAVGASLGILLKRLR